ncbi:MAG: DNA cytosine methyltransferase [Candidatus Diapherotrites archaeon]
MTIKILDLFAGAAGLSQGFELVRDKHGNPVFELYRAAEIDKYACKTLRKIYGEDKVIEGDLTDPEIHNKVIKKCKGKIDIVVGGIPCQSFSLIGPRSGYGRYDARFKDDLRDHLYKEFYKIVDELKPKVIVIENVKGILSKKDISGRKIIDKIIEDFEKNYNLQNETGKKYSLVNAANFGVPQKRERVIIIGVLKDWKKIAVPSLRRTHFDPKTENSIELSAKGLLPYVTLYEAIGDLPKVKPKKTGTGLSKKIKKTIAKENEIVYSGEEKMPFNKKDFINYKNSLSQSGKSFFEFIRPNGYQFIDYHIARSQQPSDIKLFEAMLPGETAGQFMKRCPKLAKRLIKYGMNSFLDKYRKQKPNEPSTTIFAHLEKDGNRFIHPEQARTFTVREAARIQSFPDHIPFEGPISKKFKQIGNAVPPLLSFNIAKSIMLVF